jgi:hypothetical protein
MHADCKKEICQEKIMELSQNFQGVPQGEV